MRGDKKRPRAGQWLRFWPNPEVRLGSASLDYNSQKARRRGRGSSSSGKVDTRTRQHRKRELGLGSGWGLSVCVSEFLRGAETRSQIGGRSQDTDAWGVVGLGKAGPGLGLTSRSDSENGIRRETAGTPPGRLLPLSGALRSPSPLVLVGKDSCYKPVIQSRELLSSPSRV